MTYKAVEAVVEFVVGSGEKGFESGGFQVGLVLFDGFEGGGFAGEFVMDGGAGAFDFFGFGGFGGLFVVVEQDLLQGDGVFVELSGFGPDDFRAFNVFQDGMICGSNGVFGGEGGESSAVSRRVGKRRWGFVGWAMGSEFVFGLLLQLGFSHAEFIQDLARFGELLGGDEEHGVPVAASGDEGGFETLFDFVIYLLFHFIFTTEGPP